RPGLRDLDRPPPRPGRAEGRGVGPGLLRTVPGAAAGDPGLSDLFELEPAPRQTDGVVIPPDTPLADRMRPRSLGGVEGREEVVGATGFLRRAIAEDRVPSLILWGAPGVGKTTLAKLIAAQPSSRFVSYSAVATGVKEMREVLEEARLRRRS